MTTSHHGITSHLMVESIERLTKWIQSEGFSAQEAERGAVQISLVLVGGYSREAARVAANEIAAQRRGERS